MMLLGQFVSPLVLGLLVPAFGLRAPFAAVAVLAVVETVAVAAAFHPDRSLAVPPDTPEPVTTAARLTGPNGAS
jgi:MFS family permease